MTHVGQRMPDWLRKRLPPDGQAEPVLRVLRELRLNTVCREAHCPNAAECAARGTATFMILGRVCTRDCTFCAVHGGAPEPVDPDEPARVAEAAVRLGLRHVVVTSVTRDDLPDGGSAHFAATVCAVHRLTDATVEVLTPDFRGHAADVDRVLDAAPEVFNHNVETVPRLYPEIRPQADYARSLAVLARAAEREGPPVTKSGLMLGMGETEDEVRAVLADLRSAGCRVVTIGQYLAPSAAHRPVAEFVPPERFERLAEAARETGFDAVESGPFVRSSYRAERAAALLTGLRSRSCFGGAGSAGGGRTTEGTRAAQENAMAQEVKLPPLGDGAPDAAEVSFWYVTQGERIEQGQDMVEMITDKAAFTVPAPVSGKVQSILAAEGDRVQVGQVMAIVED